MASVVDICNMALSHIGSRAQIASITPVDGSVESGYCARFYPIARKEALDAGTWTWSKRRILLAPVANPSAVWGYAYAVPSDCLTALRVLQASYLVDYTQLSYYTSAPITADDLNGFTERGSANFEIEGDVLLTNEANAVLLYVVDVVDTSKWSASFTTFVSYLLAGYLAGPIIKGITGAQTAGEWRKIAAQVRGEAAVNDANQSASCAEYIPAHLARR